MRRRIGEAAQRVELQRIQRCRGKLGGKVGRADEPVGLVVFERGNAALAIDAADRAAGIVIYVERPLILGRSRRSEAGQFQPVFGIGEESKRCRSHQIRPLHHRRDPAGLVVEIFDHAAEMIDIRNLAPRVVVNEI